MSYAPESGDRPATSDRAGGYWLWRCAAGDFSMLFAGRGPRSEAAAVFAAVSGDSMPVARARQTHSATVLRARPGWCGAGDALIGDGRQVALAIATADCVPVLIAGAAQAAAVHVGWRGLSAGLLGRALERLADPAAAVVAWIGPAIGPCCYEVGPEVAAAVTGASGAAVEGPGPRGRPHLDLPAAAAAQLEAGGVSRIETIRACTRCLADRLWSHRRDGAGCGRNYSFIWRRPHPPGL